MENTAGNSGKTGVSFIGVALRASLLFLLLCGIVYPLAMTGVAQTLMPDRANGSLIRDSQDNVVGSELIGQNFSDPAFFQGRVSSIDYNGAGSGSSNYAPSNPELLLRMRNSIEAWKKDNPDVPESELPVSLITNSGSGLDPHITPLSAKVQVPRISKLTGIPVDDLEQLVRRHTEGRDLGLIGEPRVNVLMLNLELQAMENSRNQ
ncbi:MULTISPECIES: potassium-transporting ATPase subunit KdpC [Cohnella]|uniref:Potassium-transporting ATPase KdpC subunit n=1 Tax=Cohnella phaseoli TaxID=456490 RepID=A0A3D9HZG9_9BACL|nr:potassium-transporting ATPase subunit KdpC [Cohnella phaseoli]RED54897.1 K+-transporting ATPase ATPase C chain [Cohnella phaseoli]